MAENVVAPGGVAPEIGPRAGLIVGAGVALACAAWVWALLAPAAGLPVRAALVFGGLVLAGVGLTRALRTLGRTVDDRLAPAGLTILSGAAALVGRAALVPGWDSLGLLLGLLGTAGIVGAFLVLLPWTIRCLVVSLLAVVHLGGIAVAIVTVPPPEGPAPWVASQLFVRLYRPWLQLLHLNNGYHFYAPEPGPVALLWFRVQFADGTSTWVKLPEHPKCRTGLETRRMGALSTMSSMTVQIEGQRLEELAALRRTAKLPPEAVKAAAEGLKTMKHPRDPDWDGTVPMSGLPLGLQYREPAPQAKMLLASYVRFLARTTRHPTDPTQAVTGVKVYRVDFHNPSAVHIQAGHDPMDPTLYWGYYQGDYGPDGVIKPECLKVTYDEMGNQELERRQDSFLYWMLPILRKPHSELKATAAFQGGLPKANESWVMNWVRIHAGDGAEEKIP